MSAAARNGRPPGGRGSVRRAPAKKAAKRTVKKSVRRAPAKKAAKRTVKKSVRRAPAKKAAARRR